METTKTTCKKYTIEYSPYAGLFTFTLYDKNGNLKKQLLEKDDNLEGFCNCLEIFGYVNVSDKI